MNSDLIDTLSRLGNVESDILEIKAKKLNKIFSDLQPRDNVGENYYLPFYVGDTAYRISWGDLKKYIESGASDHFKGDYVSYEQLVSSVLNPTDGDYAYVEEGTNELKLYIWDADDNIWRMSSASQFLKETVFNLFQEEILNGTLPVGKAKDYTEDGEIGLKFAELEKNKGVTLYKGSELESIEFEQGAIYLCTEESESFQLNQLYYGDKDKNIRKLTSSLVSLEPALITFTLNSPTGTMEVGTSVSTVSYSFGLKYPNKLVNGYSELYYGSNLVHSRSSLSTSNTGSVSYSILNSTVGTKNFALKIYSDGVSKFSSSKSYSVAQRYYYGITSSNVNAQTLTTDLANINFKNVKANSDTVKTSLSKLSSVTLNIPSNSYIWFLVPTSTSINSATSGGFDFPYQLQGYVTMTNSYGIELTYKVYRSSNQVYGDMTILLS